MHTCTLGLVLFECCHPHSKEPALASWRTKGIMGGESVLPALQQSMATAAGPADPQQTLSSGAA